MTDPDKSKIRVLVAEDDEANRFLMELILEEIRCVYEFANNGKEAVEAVRNKKFDLIFMDLRMPIMDGLEATRIIRSEIDRVVNIVAVTAHVVEDVREKCAEAGMNGFISKPFDVDYFKAEIRGWIEKTGNK